MLGPSFYTRTDVTLIARELIGKRLVSRTDGTFRSGIIIETEAYNGARDRACHAYKNRRTERTKVMFEKGGVAYVYLCYGIHSLFNVVTGEEGDPQAVLIRGIFQQAKTGSAKIISGPGRVCQALRIHYSHSGLSLVDKKKIWIEESDFQVDSRKIKATPRIGVDYAGKDAKLPYRFVLEI